VKRKHLLLWIALESVPGTHQYLAMRVNNIDQANNRVFDGVSV